MNKAVLISIRPEWCKLIASGRKTVEARKNKPKLSKPFKCFIYCTMPNPTHQKDVVEIAGKCINGKVWAEFTCFNIESFTTDYRQDEEIKYIRSYMERKRERKFRRTLLISGMKFHLRAAWSCMKSLLMRG